MIWHYLFPAVMFVWCWVSLGLVTALACVILGFLAFIILYACIMWRIDRRHNA